MRSKIFALILAALFVAGVAWGSLNYPVPTGGTADSFIVVDSDGDSLTDKTAAESIALLGLDKSAAQLDYIILTAEITDVSTSGSSWVVCPIAGDIVAIYSVIDGAIATANASLTFEIGGVAVTGGSITIAYSGSAAGDVDSCTPTAANSLTEGQALELITSGASTNTVTATLTIVIDVT